MARDGIKVTVMTIDESEVGKTWLNQFPLVEREIGRQLLRSLRLVSHTKLETAISQVLKELFEELSSENIALFSVIESSNGEDDEGPPRRIPGSSADRVKSLNENLARLYGPRVQAHPTLHSMKAQRMKHVVLVDDDLFAGQNGTDAQELDLIRLDKALDCFIWRARIRSSCGPTQRVWSQRRPDPARDSAAEFGTLFLALDDKLL
jgi:hypothetical protein